MNQHPEEQQQTELEQKPQQKGKGKALLIEMAFNILIPVLILSKLSSNDYLGSFWALILALSFPLTYGAIEFARERKINIFSAIGLVSTLLTGGIGVLELDPQYIAIKEAAVPGLIGLAILISIKTGHPLVRVLLLNERLVNTQKINQALAAHNTEEEFNKKMITASWIVAFSFAVSSVLNYALAKYIVVSEPGTEAFNQELGKMLAISFPVIAIPATIIMTYAMFYIFRHIEQLTDLKFDEIMNV